MPLPWFNVVFSFEPQPELKFNMTFLFILSDTTQLMSSALLFVLFNLYDASLKKLSPFPHSFHPSFTLLKALYLFKYKPASNFPPFKPSEPDYPLLVSFF
jgi:hypothetical protein